MRVTVLSTRTNNTPAFYEPLRGLGHEVSIVVYDLLAGDAMGYLPHLVGMNKPDWVLLIGAHERYHDRPVPTVDVLAQVGASWPLVHLCCDGGEPVWWEQLERYYDRGRFALQVNIDGVRTGPIGERGLTLLSPFDPAPYPSPARPWQARPITLGFAGSEGAPHQPRGDIVSQLRAMGLLTVRARDDAAGAVGYIDFMSACKLVLNAPWTGSSERTHVKGRVVEAGLAGAVLLEHSSSPLADWFTPGVDYVVYSNAGDVARAVSWASEKPAEASTMAVRFRGRVLAEHSPKVFWDHVMASLGLKTGDPSPARRGPDLPLRKWREPIQRHPGDDQPILVTSARGLNLVAYLGRAYIVPQALGPVDIHNEEHRRKPGIVSFESVEHARSALG